MAVTELAVCLPLLMILLLGSLEVTGMIFLKQTLTLAAYEGARAAVTSSQTDETVKAVSKTVLDDRKVSGATVSISPSSHQTAPIETWITVTVTAPASKNSVLQGLVSSGRDVTARVTMMKVYQ